MHIDSLMCTRTMYIILKSVSTFSVHHVNIHEGGKILRSLVNIRRSSTTATSSCKTFTDRNCTLMRDLNLSVKSIRRAGGFMRQCVQQAAAPANQPGRARKHFWHFRARNAHLNELVFIFHNTIQYVISLPTIPCVLGLILVSTNHLNYWSDRCDYRTRFHSLTDSPWLYWFTKLNCVFNKQTITLNMIIWSEIC